MLVSNNLNKKISINAAVEEFLNFQLHTVETETFN